MSRTYRRRGQQHEYRWVLRELDRYSPEARRAIARFHSDAQVTMQGGVPRWFRRIFKRRQRNANTRQLLRWLADMRYDPVMNARHRSSAKWAWW